MARVLIAFHGVPSQRAEPPTPHDSLADNGLQLAVLIDSASKLTMTLFMTHGRSFW